MRAERSEVDVFRFIYIVLFFLRNAQVVIIHNLTDMQFSNQIFRTKVKMDEDEDEESWVGCLKSSSI